MPALRTSRAVRRPPAGTLAASAMDSWGRPPRGANDRVQDAIVRSAAAKIASERLLRIGSRHVRLASKEGGAAHHHPAHAVTALRRLLGDERRLQRMRLVRRAEAFDRRDAPTRRP